MFLILLSALIIGQIAALTSENFLLTLHNKCFHEGSLLWKPEGAVSIENFIYMVEKLERNNDINTPDLVKELLQRFSCNRLKPDSVDHWIRDSTGTWFEKIVTIFLNGEQTTKQISSLTDEDECQIFFMLSPATQEVMDKDSDGSVTEEVKSFYEHGVASLNGDRERAVDLSKVLYGILAGFKGDKIKRVGDFLHPDDAGTDADKELDMLYFLTLSEVINTAAEKSKTFDMTDNWRNGQWNSSICTKEYLHNSEIMWPTTAEIVGAIDGFTLGSKIKSLSNKNDIKLSQILRMYYSKEGFKETPAELTSVSYCKRLDDLQYEASKLEEQTFNYMLVYRKLSQKPTTSRDKVISDAVARFRPPQFLHETEAEEKDCLKTLTGDTCETPSNVFTFLDKRDIHLDQQRPVVGKLINGLDIGLDEDTITIYSNDDVENLNLVLNASDSEAQASCALEAYTPVENVNNVADDSKVLTDIKNMLTIYEDNQKSLLAVPAKVVVIFNIGMMKTEEKRSLEKATRELRSRHPFAMMIPIGTTNEDYLKAYFTNNQPSRVLQLTDQNLAVDLKKRICEVPSVLQYAKCTITRSSFQDSEHTAYIRERHVQYWAMYPKHFLKTFGYKFQFKAQHGNIRVCFSRKEPVTDSGNSTKCPQTKSDSDFVEFVGSNPCKGKSVHNCDPFYFSVFGRDPKDGAVCNREIDGKNVGCRRLDQIEYSIKHEGISCNSAKQLISSPLFQTLLTLLITFYVLAWKK